MYKLLIFFIIFFSLSPAMASESSLTLGIYPRRNAELTYTIFTPLADHLSSELGIEVTLDVSKNFETFWQKLTTGKFDLIHCNQYHYLAAHRDYNFEVTGTNVEFGKTTIAGSIVVRKDSGFNTLTDLKGKKIVFGGGINSMQSYILATHLLRQAGLAVGDYEEDFAINPPNAVLATYYQQADAAGSCNLIMNMAVIKDRIDTSHLKFLTFSEQLPQLPWALSKSLSSELRIQIHKILTTMNQSEGGLAALNAASLDKIIPVNDRDFDPFRIITKDIKGQQF